MDALNSLNRLLSKLAYVSKVEGGLQRRTAVYYDVHEDSSSGRAHKFATEVEFGKKSNVLWQRIPNHWLILSKYTSIIAAENENMTIPP